MSIPATLPDGFLALNTPVAFHARALLLMIAETDAFQEWCGVGSAESACHYLDMIQSEVQANQDGQSITSPNVCLQIPSQTWGKLDRDQAIFRNAEFELIFSASAGQSSLSLGCLEFVERVGRVIQAIGSLSGQPWTGQTSSWPVIETMAETGPAQISSNDNDSIWSCVWQITVEGPK